MENDIKSIDLTYVENTYGRFDLLIKDGKGSVAYDENGKEYIDLAAGIAVNIFGYCDEKWKKAVEEQLLHVQHTSNLYYSEPCAKLAEMLCQRTGMKKVFFGNSGAEANECAIKTARKYSHDKYGDGRHTIITLKNSFHGRTMATLTATGQDDMHKYFGPFCEGFVYANANDIEEIKNLVSKGGICAIMMELVQGEGGVCALEEAYVKMVAKLAEENDVLLIIDEVQTGNGRTGALYCYMNYGITPDIVTTAKGLGGGLPIGAVMMGNKTAGVMSAGMHGSTFGGNPICAAGAVNILSRIDDVLLAEVNKKAEYISTELTGAKNVENVSGMGLMIGIATKKPAKEIAKECINRGVLVITAKTKVRLLPALNIPWDELKKAINILKEVIAE